MKKKKKILLNSLILSFLFSFITVSVLYDNFNSVLYTSVFGSVGGVSVSGAFIFKVFSILFLQTSFLGLIFYTIAKKIFLNN